MPRKTANAPQRPPVAPRPPRAPRGAAGFERGVASWDDEEALPNEDAWADEDARAGGETATTSAAGRGLRLGRLNIGLALSLTVGLALALLLAGLGGVGYDAALRAALRAPTAADEASVVCADLHSQNYDALAAEMDPTADGANAGPFDRQAFVAGLRALDQREGTVRDCSLHLLGDGADGASVLFNMTVSRTRVADPLGSLVVVRPRARGGWAITRASTFYNDAG